VNTDPSSQPLSIAMIGLRGVPATYGGVERAVEELSASLADRGHDVTVFARKAYSDESVTLHRQIHVVHLGQVNTKHLEAITHTAVALVAALRARKYDVIHLHATGPTLLAFLPRMFRKPVVATVQGLDYRRDKWNLAARTVLRLAARSAVVFPDRTIVVSRELQRHYRDDFGAETVYIPNGVEAEQGGTPVDDLKPDRFILSLGRLVPEKRIHTLISAYKKVGTDVPLIIAGPDSHSPEYVRRLEELASDDPRIRLSGPKYDGDKAWLMNNATAFVQASSIEGLPIALLEALGSGRFPIVSDIPENLEPVTLPDGERLGLQVRVDDEDDLARALREVLVRDDRAAVGAALREHVLTEYDWPRLAASTEAVYRDAIAGHKPRRRRGRKSPSGGTG
jgi:glycosyltransferase involved in cell wall biosynthesis